MALKTGFQVGWAETDITPSDSILLAGYGYDRPSTGIHDRLCARSMAVSDGVNRIVLCVCDLIEMPGDLVPRTRALVRENCGLSATIQAKTRWPSQKELKEARALMATPAPEGVDFTLPRVEAERMVLASELGRTVALDITVLAFGNVAIVGIPAEYFAELGRSITNRSPFAHTLVCTLANGCVGYVAARQNYDEGGYEVASTPLLPGVGEAMADKAVELLRAAAERLKKS